MPDFILTCWRAWAPALKITGDNLIEAGEINPANIPKLLQRRLTPLAKAVFNAAAPCLKHGDAMPVVLSSAHGEICKSLAMLQTIQAGEELSPTAFSLSVHNAIAGLFSIAFNINQEITVIAPCAEGIAAAFIEAMGMLHEGKTEVLVLLYDEPIAEFYPVEPYNLNSDHPCVIALKLARSGAGLALSFQFSGKNKNDGEQPAQLLTFIQYLLGNERELHLGNPGHSWTWRKH